MSEYSHIKRCLELGERDIASAVESRDACKDLLDHLASISKPNDGAPKILLVFARMATTACEWIEGELRIEVVGDGEVSVVELMSELGGGLRERVLPSFGLNVPLIEFTRAVDRVPHMIAPLTTKTKTARRVVFTATEETRKTSMPPPMVEIGEDSLFIVPGTPKVPMVGGRMPGVATPMKGLKAVTKVGPGAPKAPAVTSDKNKTDKNQAGTEADDDGWDK